tara:strand:+ start:2270 stop:2845 length:576 start_codon:yes stop_codon:yes gene_type:complete
MHLKNFIEIYDNAINIKSLSQLIRFVSNKQFEDARILGHNNNDTVNKDVRRTQLYCLNHSYNSLSNVHWSNYMRFCLSGYIRDYMHKHHLNNTSKTFVEGIDDVTVLKYEQTGFYTYHTDHCKKIPRTLSMILLLNNDYEGGQLSFRWNEEEHRIDTKANRLIIWPSNFMYPHSVFPVTKGKRYSVVAWAV